MSLDSKGPGSLGLAFKFDDSEKLLIDEIQSDSIAAKVCCIMMCMCIYIANKMSFLPALYYYYI